MVPQQSAARRKDVLGPWFSPFLSFADPYGALLECAQPAGIKSTGERG